MTVLVSACLLGVACRYDGASKGLPDSVLRELMARHTLVPACPEQLGGLPTPRAPSERLGSRVVARTGADVTDAYTRGAQQTLALAQRFGCTAALLKQRSPRAAKGRSTTARSPAHVCPATASPRRFCPRTASVSTGRTTLRSC